MGRKARSAAEMKALFEALPRTAAGCWEWPNGIQNGYGKSYYRGIPRYAHRLAYQLFRGNPGHKCVLHRCDNRRCCNPDHLFLGTRADNIADMWAKGRQSTSAQRATYGNARLLEADVKEIRRMYATGAYSQQQIADAFGINQTAVSKVVRRVSWGHIT